MTFEWLQIKDLISTQTCKANIVGKVCSCQQDVATGTDKEAIFQTLMIQIKDHTGIVMARIIAKTNGLIDPVAIGDIIQILGSWNQPTRVLDAAAWSKISSEQYSMRQIEFKRMQSFIKRSRLSNSNVSLNSSMLPHYLQDPILFPTKIPLVVEDNQCDDEYFDDDLDDLDLGELLHQQAVECTLNIADRVVQMIRKAGNGLNVQEIQKGLGSVSSPKEEELLAVIQGLESDYRIFSSSGVYFIL